MITEYHLRHACRFGTYIYEGRGANQHCISRRCLALVSFDLCCVRHFTHNVKITNPVGWPEDFLAISQIHVHQCCYYALAEHSTSRLFQVTQCDSMFLNAVVISHHFRPPPTLFSPRGAGTNGFEGMFVGTKIRATALTSCWHKGGQHVVINLLHVTPAGCGSY